MGYPSIPYIPLFLYPPARLVGVPIRLFSLPPTYIPAPISERTRRGEERNTKSRKSLLCALCCEPTERQRENARTRWPSEADPRRYETKRRPSLYHEPNHSWTQRAQRKKKGNHRPLFFLSIEACPACCATRLPAAGAHPAVVDWPPGPRPITLQVQRGWRLILWSCGLSGVRRGR